MADKEIRSLVGDDLLITNEQISRCRVADTVILTLCLIFAQTGMAANVNVDLNSTNQTIRGFGGMNFPRWIGTLTDAQVDKAFGNGSGQIGLTILRCDVPPNSSNWSGEVSAAQRAINSHGAIVLATPWSPPASMKTNGSTTGGELKTDAYDDYADYLSDFADYMSSNGASLYAISIQNEPDYLPDYESCGWSPTQMQNFLNNNASVIPTKVLAPETCHYESDYVDAVASSSECNIVGVHLYGGSITYYSGKEYWQTEHYTSSDVSGDLWPDALEVGKEIHDCMTANMSAYIWWYIRRFYGPIDEDGHVTKRGYVMSQYAKFVRPGYVRVDATANPSSDVYVTAYKSDSNLVIVAVNQNSSSSSVTFSLSGGSVSSYTKYETSSSNNVSNQGSVGSTNTLAANSINTFVGTIGGGLPGQATNPNPGNGVFDVSIDADLSWTAGSGATSHDVYFGTDSTPDSGEFQGNQPDTTFDPGTLSYSTTYYWRIDEKNDSGTTTGEVWSFATAPAPPGQATNPSPTNGAPDVSINTDLSWTAGSDANSHDVYFGTSSPGTFQGNQPDTTFDPGTLSYNTTYYWRIDEKNASGTTTGDVWSFTTSAPDTTPPTPDPCWASPPAATGQTSITMTSTTATDAESPPVYYYFECTTDGDANSDWQTDTTYVATGLNPLTSYTFRVKARDNVQNETAWSIEESATTYPPTGGDVEIIGDWVSGLTHTEEAGTNRALVFIAHEESASGTPTLTSVTYGEQEMTKVIEITSDTTGSNYRNYVAGFILDEAGIAAASGNTFDPTWSASTSSVAYASVFLSNVDQTDPVGDSDSAGTASGINPITTNPLTTDGGDMVILGATCGNYGSYTLNNSFTEGSDQAFGTVSTGATGVTGHKSATGVPETPSATYDSTVNRQVLIGFVVQGGGEWLYGDFTGDDIVDMNDMPGFCGFWLMDDCSDTNAIDLNEDCLINFHEFSAIGSNWLKQ